MVRTLVRGLAAGAAGAWAKNAATTWVYEHEDPAARAQEDDARDGFAYDVAVQKVAAAARLEPTEEQVRKAGQVLHWGLGIGSVLLYAYLRRRMPQLAKGYGLAFGLPFTWLLLDEAANPVLGLSPPPQRFPWQTHVRAAAGHTVLWLTAESVLRATDR